MQFTHAPHAKGSTFTRLSMVAVVHVAVAFALIASMSSVRFTPAPPDGMTVDPLPADPPRPPEPPPPVEPPTLRDAPPLTDIVQPVIDVVVPPLPGPPTITTRPPDDLPHPPPGPLALAQPPAQPAHVGMRKAALAEACKEPPYPLSALREGISGNVTLALLIGADGNVLDARVDKSSGSRDLDRAARAALSLCRFKPAMRDGVPEPSWGALTYVWHLDE